MSYGLFLGCVAPNRYPGIESSTREVFKILGIDYQDLENASCCPAPGIIRSFDINSWLAVGARNLCLAEKQGVDIITICNGCYGSLFEVALELKNEEKRMEINKILKPHGLEYNGGCKVRHFVDVLYSDIGPQEIGNQIEKPLELNAAIHYGCHFLKPSKHKRLDDPERPKILEELVRAVGGKSVDYKEKYMCCGAGGGVRARIPEVAMKITKEKLDHIKEDGSNLILDICPLCHLQYDHGQSILGNYNLPVVHLSQFLGLALEIDRKKLGFEVHKTPVNL
jgi:heterodisulfide reductase subunit B